MENFDDIRPYNEDEAPAAYHQLMEDKRFQDAIVKCLPNYTIDDFRRDFEKFHSIYDVQVDFDKRFIDVFVSQFTKGVTFQGVENVDPQRPTSTLPITEILLSIRHFCNTISFWKREIRRKSLSVTT